MTALCSHGEPTPTAAPSTADRTPIGELHEHAVRLAMEAWDGAYADATRPTRPHPIEQGAYAKWLYNTMERRSAFEAAVRERLAQVFQVVALERGEALP